MAVAPGRPRGCPSTPTCSGSWARTSSCSTPTRHKPRRPLHLLGGVWTAATPGWSTRPGWRGAAGGGPGVRGARLRRSPWSRTTATRPSARPAPRTCGPAGAAATNAFPGLVAPIRRRDPRVRPRRVTEPLAQEQWAAWASGTAGLSDCGNQFHYYRPTPDDRIRGAAGTPSTTTATGWGLTWSRTTACPHAGRALPGDVPPARGHPLHPPLGRADRHDVAVHVHGRHPPRRQRGLAVGYTGLGVGRAGSAPAWRSTCWPGDTERTRLTAVRRPPFPFP